MYKRKPNQVSIFDNLALLAGIALNPDNEWVNWRGSYRVGYSRSNTQNSFHVLHFALMKDQEDGGTYFDIEMSDALYDGDGLEIVSMFILAWVLRGASSDNFRSILMTGIKNGYSFTDT